ncbi:hypothetical protein KOAAANKH_01308 [Brevundimonas sp. NIBR10]|uniref:glycosyltransferase n=1 Tax=Brevundimonas sp. NIBR10 TaxID=3015997 RepID=UPI0022F16F7E|nr:glycosyltransferase [Brevundimonas sp. NIBR10]WGM46440.1 hypothetical protein KOAAANKH_01308 [Brevundimonas sp. NIBR10]
MSTKKKKAGGLGRTLLICDPTCVLPYGHTVPALNHFRKDLGGDFDAVHCLASTGLPKEVAAEFGFDRRFTFLYNRYIPIMSPAQSNQIVNQHPAFDDDYADPFERVATYDAAGTLADYKITSDDVIFFPGADFYGVIGFLNALADAPQTERPTVYIRLIGVLEGSSPYYDDGTAQFFKRVRAASEGGLDIRLSAETPEYADLISGLTGLTTFVTPYPETSEQVPLPDGDDFTVLCAGSARLDKGFLDLFGIARESLANPPKKLGLKFVTQTLPLKGHEQWDSYTSQLYALRGVTLLDPVITSEKMHDLYRDSDIVLLPYARDVYRLRGSAVMMEAASVGRLCITLRGTAFARQVEYYGLGDLVDEPSQMPAAIRRLANGGREEMAERIRQARARFYLDVRCSYENWFRSERG